MLQMVPERSCYFSMLNIVTGMISGIENLPFIQPAKKILAISQVFYLDCEVLWNSWAQFGVVELSRLVLLQNGQSQINAASRVERSGRCVFLSVHHIILCVYVITEYFYNIWGEFGLGESPLLLILETKLANRLAKRQHMHVLKKQTNKKT